MKKIGIFRGVEKLFVVVTENNKVLSVDKIPFQEKEITTIKLETILNRIARELGIKGTDEIYFILSDKECIVRSFIIPYMRKREIQGTIEFEIERYLPFRLEELMWNYSYCRLPKSKLLVSFLAIKKDIFTQIEGIFGKLGLNLMLLEPACIALYRVIKNNIVALRKVKNFVLIDHSSQECHITFFCNTLPVFNRTIFSYTGEGVISDVTIPKDTEVYKDKILSEIRFSFQYFQREFGMISMEKIVVLSEEDCTEIFSSLKEELNVQEILYVKPSHLMSQTDMNVDSIKAYGATTVDSAVYKFIPSFEDKSGFLCSKKGIVYHLNPLIVGGVIMAGLIGVILFNFTLQQKIEFQKRALKSKEKEVSTVGEDFAYISLEEIEDKLNNDEKMESTLRDRINRKIEIAPVLALLKSLLTENMWWDNLNYRISIEGKPLLEISGYIFMGSASVEAARLDSFIKTIERNKEIKEVFRKVELLSKERVKLNNVNVTHFKLKLHNE